jgi:hypothetical protein
MKYELDLVGVQEVRWDMSDDELADNSFMEEGRMFITYVQTFICIRESDQLLREQSLLAMSCR